MEEKMYSLMEKMYIELIDIKKDIGSNKDEIHNTQNGIVRLEDEVRNTQNSIVRLEDEVRKTQNSVVRLEDEVRKTQNSVVRLENELTPKVEALFDGYKLHSEILNRIESKVDNLTKIVEKHEIEIKVIKNII